MILLVLKSFLLATVISFAGSVQLGPVNFGTIHTALNKDKSSAILFGFGGSLPELLYSGLAFGGATFILQFEELQEYLKYLTSGILLVFWSLFGFTEIERFKYCLSDQRRELCMGRYALRVI